MEVVRDAHVRSLCERTGWLRGKRRWIEALKADKRAHTAREEAVILLALRVFLRRVGRRGCRRLRICALSW